MLPSGIAGVAGLAKDVLGGAGESTSTLAKYAGRFGENQMGKLHGTSAAQFKQLGQEGFGNSMRASYDLGDANLGLGSIGREQAINERVAQLGSDLGDIRGQATEAGAQMSPKDMADSIQKEIGYKYAPGGQHFGEQGSFNKNLDNIRAMSGEGKNPTELNVFRGSNKGGPIDAGDWGKGAYHTGDESIAKSYARGPIDKPDMGGTVSQANLKMQNPLVFNSVEDANAFRNKMLGESSYNPQNVENSAKMESYLRDNGYDGVVTVDGKGTYTQKPGMIYEAMKLPGEESTLMGASDFAKRSSEINSNAAGSKMVLPAKSAAETDIAGQMSHINDANITKNLTGDVADQYGALKEQFGYAKNLQPMEMRGQAKEALSPTPNTAFGMAKSIAHSVVGGPKMGAQAGFGSEAALNGISRIVNLVKTNPSSFGKFAPAMLQAYQGGGSEGVAATHYVLSLQHPDYNSLALDDSK
jgi:hypothetical protein